VRDFRTEQSACPVISVISLFSPTDTFHQFGLALGTAVRYYVVYDVS